MGAWWTKAWTLLARSEVWLQSVKENLLLGLNEVWESFFVKKEGERAKKRSTTI